MERFVPEHPLPTEIREMPKDDTVCQFCGVSYLIHSEMKALEERVKEAERKMQYYVESVEREEKLKIKVASMEEESDKLSRALQASDERTKILVQDLTSKQNLIENYKQERDNLGKQLERKSEEVRRIQLKLTDLVKQISAFHETLQTQRTALNDIKVSVGENYQSITESHSKVIKTVALSCEKFTEDTKVLEKSLIKCKNEKKMQDEAIAKAEALVVELTSKCTELEIRVDAQEEELIKTKEQNHTYSKEVSQYKELMSAKSNEVSEWKNKLQNESEILEEEIKKNKEDILSKEKQIQQLAENCKNLEKRVAEYSKARNEVEEKSANSLEEIKALKESCSKAKNEVVALKEEREMMISAHHNRIEQLRESFKKKMEEADAWPEKLNKIVKEKEVQFNEEKNNLWRELTEGFQKEMDEEQKKHQEELGLWRKEAKAAQDRFKEDVAALNWRHREDVKRLERELIEAKEKCEQKKNADDSLVQNLEAKIVDLENRLRQPLVDSVEVLKLRTRLQESDKMLQDAEQQIDELETKSESWKQESPCNTDPCRKNMTCQPGYTSKGYRCRKKVTPMSLNSNKPAAKEHIHRCSDAPSITGVYNISHHDEGPFPVYCDQTSDGEGWTMVFKVVSGLSPPHLGEIWLSPSLYHENLNETFDITSAYPTHYKNRIVMDWEYFDPKEVRKVVHELY